MSPSNGVQNGGGGGGNGVSYIQHQVSKLDTLAGVAIKYGVEVADIKRMNGLATDLQMFALKTLKIPLPGRHPPSPAPGPHDEPAKLRDSSIERKPLRIGQSAMKEPLQSLRLKPPQPNISPAMSILQKFYGLQSSSSRDSFKGTEMAVYTSASSDHSRGEWLPKALPISDLPSASNDYPKSTNLVLDLLTGDDVGHAYVPLAEIGDGGAERSDEKSVRRRQKAEVDNGASTPEKILKEGNGNGSNGFSSGGKTLAMRPKSASRTALFPESESGWLDSIPVGLGESIFTDGFAGVRKSSSASSLREQEKNNSATAWPPAIWGLKPDLQVFDGLPIPITGRRSKAALD
ncbi:LysM and putative peptidoglycan-binding domain-containing protein 2 [Mucuna pruriens]|uniref:LysM and putative peptidoglycan-binding domain-containing protein 2 n=1 Tax=Mucuna pruriens TaxID=157652 RepID=A0A371EZ23_MUCPR|nr:LysM and putative peptidoglycan-binding domain-containing protein 2 [Mucuna pruriens]